MERSFEKETTKLGELESDLKMMVVKAPTNGIVYYGTTQRGKWITAATVEKKLIAGGRPTVREVMMTVVDPKALQLRVAIPEDKLTDLAKGQKGTVSMKWNSDLKLDTQLESISYVPLSNATFSSVFSLDTSKEKKPVYPGMNAKVKLKTYCKKNALVVPKTAVKKEGEKSYVMKDGKKHWVEVGKSTKTKIEIISGLKAGDKIEAGEAPKPAATATKK